MTVAERERMLPPSLTKRLVNHARPTDVTEGDAADWSIGQLRGPAQRIADRIDALMNGGETDHSPSALPAPMSASATMRGDSRSAGATGVSS